MKNIFEIVESQDLNTLKQYIFQNPKALGEENEAGVPALHLLVEMGDLESVKFSIEYSIVNPCIVDKSGNTILHCGVKSGNLELVKYLVERVSAPIDRANLFGVTAFDLAWKQEETGIYEYFCECMGSTLDELYHNPIRRGMHPDPSIVRVGEDYYMVNSSFMFFPCIPISHSKDLLHWEVIGHAITNPEWARLKDLEGGRGYWAPDISYYEGKFYITATYRLNDGGEKLRYQMVTSSDKPEGPYCEPVFLDEDGIDPSIFTDVDGRRYMLLNRGARIFEISADGREIISEPRLLWYGHNQKASEGPHLLYKDGYYYLFMAEGGTGMGHRISVARSKTLMGVFEPCPYNPILRQWDEERQLQCCGHGKPVQTPDGDWYMVYLCYRPGALGYGILGRETAMDPITWTVDGWPIVNSLKGPSDLQKKPRGAEESYGAHVRRESQVLSSKTDLLSDIGIWQEWSTVRGAVPGTYEFGENQVVIHGNGLDLNTLDYGAILVKPQADFSFEMSCRVSMEPVGEVSATAAESDGKMEDAGLTCYYDENSYLKLAIAYRNGQCGILAAEYVGEGYETEQFVPLQDCEEMSAGEGESKAEDVRKDVVELRIVTEGLKRSCYYRKYIDEKTCGNATESARINWTSIATFENTSYLSSEGLTKGKRFTGAMAGIYVHGRITGVFENVNI